MIVAARHYDIIVEHNQRVVPSGLQETTPVRVTVVDDRSDITGGFLLHFDI